MRRFIQKLLRILDGSPGALGGHQRGQSLVELVLVTPLLIIMVAGIIEIGWYANHVLVLLEVTRVGARQATLFTGEYGYQSWSDNASLHPIVYKLSNGFPTAKPGLLAWPGMAGARPVLPAGTTRPDAAVNFRNCDPTVLSKNRGFYNSVICSMMNALEPLIIKGRAPGDDAILAKRIRQEYNSPTLIGEEYDGGRLWYTYKFNELFLYPDDIVVSVFSVQAINNTTAAEKEKILTPAPTPNGTPVNYPLPTVDANLYARTSDFGSRFPRGHQVIVVGRYPTNANECNVTFTPTTGPSGNPGANQLATGESFLQRVLTMGAVDEDYQFRIWDAPARDSMTAPSTNVAGTFTYETYDPANLNTWMFRDPFEFYGVAAPESSNDVKRNELEGRWVELEGIDKTPEMQRGFVYTGQHLLDDILNPATGRQLFCIGSEWSDQRVQDMMNSPSFLQKGILMPPDGDPNSAASSAWRSNPANLSAYAEWQQRARYLPSQGVVLVEMFWRHDILLDFPLMSPIIRLMEGAGGPYNIVISVWAVFPLPSAEPNLNFGFPPNND